MSEFPKGPRIVLGTCKPEISIKNYKRGLLTIVEMITQIQMSCQQGKACPYESAKLVYTELQISCQPCDFGATIFDFTGPTDTIKFFEDNQNFPLQQEHRKFQEWLTWWHNTVLDNKQQG